MRALVLSAAVVLIATASLAQTPAPRSGAVTKTTTSTTTAPAAALGKAAMTADQKKAVSKDCSTQADAQKLHGKARKEFRSRCKATGGKG